jgi:hypothetical protein
LFVAFSSAISNCAIDFIEYKFDTNVPVYAFCSFSKNVFLSVRLDQHVKSSKSHENITNLLGFTISPVIVASLKIIVQL